MKKILSAVLFFVIAILSGFAIAELVGQYYCGSNCKFETRLLSGDAYTFLYTDVNHDVDSWIDKQGEPNTVTLCNGAECATYRYVKLSGQFQLIGKVASTWKGEYQGGGGGGGGGGWVGGGEFGGGGGQCNISPVTGEACTRVDGGEKRCVKYMYQTVECS